MMYESTTWVLSAPPPFGIGRPSQESSTFELRNPSVPSPNPLMKTWVQEVPQAVARSAPNASRKGWLDIVETAAPPLSALAMLLKALAKVCPPSVYM